jgi:hypothetical protein
MIAGWMLLLWIVITVCFTHVANLQTSLWVKSRPQPPQTMPHILGLVFLALTFMPPANVIPTFLRRLPMLGRELSLPVDRRSYFRQLGMAAAISQFELWGGIGMTLIAWVLLVTPEPIPPAMIVGVLAVSGAIQIGAFGMTVWLSRGRWMRWLGGPALAILFVLGLTLQVRLRTVPDALNVVLWIAGGIAVAGLLITFDAYRRWLVTDLD